MTSRGERGQLATSILKSMQVHRVAPPRLQDKVKHVFRCFGYRLFHGTTTRYNQVFHAIGSLVVSRLNLTDRQILRSNSRSLPIRFCSYLFGREKEK